MKANISVKNTNFHPVLKDIENMFWFFLLSIRALSDYDVQNILKQKNDSNAGYGSFNEMLEKFNKTTNLNIEINEGRATSKLNILNEMIFTGKAMAILTYDFLSLSKYNTIINSDNEFKFLRYIRNGSAHSNKFNLKDEEGIWKIDDNEVIEWSGKKIDRSLQGQKVFNDFISIFEIFLLAQSFSERLKLIDDNSK